MYSLISHRGIYNEAIKKYIVDHKADMSQLPTDISPGSTCFVIEDSTNYMLNHQSQWVKINLAVGSSVTTLDDLTIDCGGAPINTQE